MAAEDIGEGLANYYRRVEREEPYELPDVLSRVTGVGSFRPADGSAPIVDESPVQLLIFALPFPADQVVATLIVDFASPDLNIDPALTQQMLDACMDGRVDIDGVDLATHIAGLGELPDVSALELPGSKPRTGLPLERHQLILLRDLGGLPRPSEEVARKLLYGGRLTFTDVLAPEGLNQDGSYGAVTSSASLLCQHSQEVEISVMLTAVQAVGTASRFQQIWQDAYHQVQDFQDNKQAKKAGVQQRKDLETLADHMGNLELDLAFSVRTAADLGLNPSTRIDSFHRDLYRVMQIRARAETVGQMFDRLGGSIRSELTAIESRERQEEEARRQQEERQQQEEARQHEERRQLDERRRRNGNLALSLLTCIIAPITFVLGFFGMNVSQVPQGQDMWSWHLFHWAWLTVIALALAPLVAFCVLQLLARRGRAAVHEAAAAG